MKFLHILDTVDPRSGGPAEVVLREAEVLTRTGVQCEIATLDMPGAADMGRISLPVHAFGFEIYGLGTLMGSTYRYSPNLVPWLRENARNYDAVIAHGIWCYNVVAVAHALRDGNVPYFIYAHGMLDPWFRQAYPFKHLKKQLYWTFALGRALEGARHVLFTAQDELLGARGCFVGHQGYRGLVVPIGTADPPGPSEGQLQAFHSALPALAGRRHILFLGRIHPKKGCDLLIEAFARAARDRPDLDLVIGGPDSVGWVKELKGLSQRLGIAERVHWPGMLTGDPKWGAFRTAEAFALPSHQENFGIAVAEALACAVPVLVTPRINIWREVEASRAGIVRSDDLTGTVDAVETFLALSAPERREMGYRGRLLFTAQFDIETTARQTLSIVQSIVGERTPPKIAS